MILLLICTISILKVLKSAFKGLASPFILSISFFSKDGFRWVCCSKKLSLSDEADFFFFFNLALGRERGRLKTQAEKEGLALGKQFLQIAQ